MDKTKVVYVVSDIDKALAFEWILAGLTDIEITFVIIGKSSTALAHYLHRNGFSYFEISDNQFPSVISKWLRLVRIIKETGPDVVHTHLWRANILGLSAARLHRVKKRIFTRHHATIHYDKYSSGLKWDKLCNWLATDIVAVSNNVKDILINRDHAEARKIHLIPHGFDLEYFANVPQNDINNLRYKYKLENVKGPIIGVIARYVDWKGIQYIIPAFKRLREKFPGAHLVLANSNGDFATTINNLLSELPSNCFVEIMFEENLAALYRLFDVYVHTPINRTVEAFGQTYVEALASGIPSVFTRSGIATEFIEHQKNAMVSDFKDSNSIYENVLKVITDEQLRHRLITAGQSSVQVFDKAKMLSKLSSLYSNPV